MKKKLNTILHKYDPKHFGGGDDLIRMKGKNRCNDGKQCFYIGRFIFDANINREMARKKLFANNFKSF
jgi:hypothetical protein